MRWCVYAWVAFSRRGARFGNVAAVDDRLQQAGVWIEEQDRGQVRRQTLLVILAVHGDELRAHAGRRRYVGRHQSEVRLRWSHRQHGANRLQHVARGEFRQR